MKPTDEPMAPAVSWWMPLVVFLLSVLIVGGTVAGPGLSWDEPAYRHSQVTLQRWFSELFQARSWAELQRLLSKDAINVYWEFNRFGHNFHPPMASYLNLATYAAMGRVWDDISARRLASALEFAGAVALLAHWLGRRYGLAIGLFAACSLLTMPRVMGDAHVIGTDMPLLFFWVLTAFAFERGLTQRRWQVLGALSLACLFLVKFSSVVILGPLGLWFLVRCLPTFPWRTWVRWLGWTALIAIPLVPMALTLLLGTEAQRGTRRPGLMLTAARWGLEHPFLLGLTLGWPALVWLWFLLRLARASMFRLENDSAGRNSVVWDVCLELPWTILALTPLVCIALNPTWWHDTVTELARYVDLNLHRQGHLPNIGIFYLGQRYFYSLPWHNALVLMGVTIPWGTLVVGIVGCGVALARCRRDLLPVYFLLHALTLPVFRMLPTPAHDGVRLFLPTFFFWAGLAGLGARAVVEAVPAARVGLRRSTWLVLALVGPGWAAVNWVRSHPFELSYYNLGLRSAVDLGFEATYWYDAITPRALQTINEKLPPAATVTVFVDPLINPEVFAALQELGRLRKDIRSNQAPDAKQFAWVWLLTHSSKATAFTRLLHAARPWMEFSHQGVRLFSVIDDRSVTLAYALWLLTVEEEDSAILGSLRLYRPVFSLKRADLEQAAALLKSHGAGAAEHLTNQPPGVVDLIGMLTRKPQRFAKLEFVLRHYPSVLDRAIALLVSRGPDVQSVLGTPGYQRPERFGGYFEP